MTANTYANKPWLSLYPKGLPSIIETEFDNMLDVFRASLRKAPDAPFLHYFDGVMNLRELDAASTALARILVDRGFGSGDRLGLYTQNNPGFVIGLVAAWKAGGMAVVISPMNKARELSYILEDSGACALLCLDTLYNEVACGVIEANTSNVRIVVTFSALDGQSLDDRRVLDNVRRLPVPEGVYDLQEIIANLGSSALPAHHPIVNDVAVLTYTSGTTGKPKAAMNTHGNMAFSAQTYRDWVGLHSGDVILGIAPLFHITGTVAHVALSLLTPCSVVLAHRFHPEVTLDLIRHHRPTFTIGAVTAFIALMTAPGARKEDFASFRTIYSGGAAISPATIAQFEEFSGLYLHNVFGMTETCSPTHMVPIGSRAPVDSNSGALSVGVPVFNTAVRILDDKGREAPIGEAGEIVDHGPQVMHGYWNQPEATAAAMPNGELRTGDIGFMDSDGWFYVVDRKKDMINAGGYKVWPREVEDVLYGHPAVREAAVVGVPDEYRGETVKAVVSLKAGMQVDKETLIDYCKANLAAYKYPRILEFVDELPKTATGKVLRRELR